METAGAASLPARAERAWRSVAAYLARAPGTHVLLLIVAVTTLMQRGLDATTATRVLRESSTNLVEMTRAAPRVLFLSAFLLDHGHLIVELVLFTVVMVPVERWIGTYRWLAVFAAGHVGATLATTIGIWLEVRSGATGRALVYPVDVGVSYGLAAVAAVLTKRLPRPLGLLAAVGIGALLVEGIVTSGTYTDWGHLAAFAIGLALAPLVRPREASPPAPADPSASLPARVWRWLSTPPAPPARSHTTAARRALGWFMVIAAVGLVAVVAVTGDTDVDLHPTVVTVRARVLGAAPACGANCRTAVVSYQLNSSTQRATVDLPGNTVMHPGDHIDLVIDPSTGAQPRFPNSARRVNASGLLGALAAIFAAVGVAVIALAGHHRRHERHADAVARDETSYAEARRS
jgi:hypothetical protein